MNLPMPLCTSTRHILSGPQFITKANAGSPRWSFFVNCQLDRLFSHENKEFAAHDSYILGDEHEKYYVPLRVGFDFNTHRNWHFAFVGQRRISGCASTRAVASSRSRSGSSRPREFLVWQIQQN
jgi:hypothetical protein